MPTLYYWVYNQNKQSKCANNKKANEVMSRMIHWEDDELSQFPNSASVAASIIPIVQECYMLWKPVDNGVGEQDFTIHIVRAMSSAGQMYINKKRQLTVDFNVLDEMDIPHIQEAVSLLITAFEKCSSIWESQDYDDMTLVEKTMNFIHMVAIKMYQSGW